MMAAGLCELRVHTVCNPGNARVLSKLVDLLSSPSLSSPLSPSSAE